MRLSINSWPAFASHFSCILLGLFFSQMGGENRNEKKMKLKTSDSLIAINSAWLFPLDATLGEGEFAKLSIVYLADGKAACQAHPTSFSVIFKNMGNFLVIGAKELDQIGLLLLPKDNYRLASSQFAKPLANCIKPTRINYGG